MLIIRKNTIGFDEQRNRLRWTMKAIAMPIEAYCIFNGIKNAQMGQMDFAKNKKGCFHERSTLIFSTMRAMTAQQ